MIRNKPTRKDWFTLIFASTGAVLILLGARTYTPPNQSIMWIGVASILFGAIGPNLVNRKIDLVELVGQSAILAILGGLVTIVVASNMYENAISDWRTMMGYGVTSILVGWPVLAICYRIKTKKVE